MTRYPLVSVIIVTYNSNPIYLEKAISSVAEQHYPHIELIIVDDHSTNGIQETLLELKVRYQYTLKLLDKNSGGPARPINEGIKLAGGKYIAVCAHDDYYFPDKIAIQVKYMEENPKYGMTYGKCYKFFTDKNKLIPMKSPKCRSGKIFNDLYLQKYYIPALTVMTRKDVFNTVGFFDENLLIEDWDMWLRISKKFEVGYIDEYLACCHVHATNSSKIFPLRMLSDRRTIINKWQELPCFSAASAINRLIDGDSARASFKTLLKDTLIAFVNMKQPYRVTRVFLSNIKRAYF